MGVGSEEHGPLFEAQPTRTNVSAQEREELLRHNHTFLWLRLWVIEIDQSTAANCVVKTYESRRLQNCKYNQYRIQQMRRSSHVGGGSQEEP